MQESIQRVTEEKEELKVQLQEIEQERAEERKEIKNSLTCINKGRKLEEVII